MSRPPEAPEPLAREVLRYIRQRRRYWLVPILLVLGLYALVLFLSETVPLVSPFLYVLF